MESIMKSNGEGLMPLKNISAKAHAAIEILDERRWLRVHRNTHPEAKLFQEAYEGGWIVQRIAPGTNGEIAEYRLPKEGRD